MSLLEINVDKIRKGLAVWSIYGILQRSGVPSQGIDKVLYLAKIAPKKAYLLVYKLVKKSDLYDLINNLNVLAK